MLPLLLEPTDFHQRRESVTNLLLVDLCNTDGYRRSHIPGAIHLPAMALQHGGAPAPGRLPEIPRLEEIFSFLGLKPEHHVVAYDDEGGGWAARLLWTLEAIGHQHYSYLNGGIHAWRAEGLPENDEIAQPDSAEVSVTLNPAPIAEIADILPRLDDADFAIWDARSREEYDGLRSGSVRAGHIPGAVNLDWLELMDRDNALRLINEESLRARLTALGLTSDKDIVTHCQTHHRSSLSWLAMKVLGYPSVKGYHGSWGEWGNREDLPVS